MASRNGLSRRRTLSRGKGIAFGATLSAILSDAEYCAGTRAAIQTRTATASVVNVLTTLDRIAQTGPGSCPYRLNPVLPAGSRVTRGGRPQGGAALVPMGLLTACEHLRPPPHRASVRGGGPGAATRQAPGGCPRR